MTQPSPFISMANELVGIRPCRRPVFEIPAHAQAPKVTLTDRIRAFIRDAGPVSAARIALELDVPGDVGRVYALLKADIQRGQIHFAGGTYQWSESYDRELDAQLKAAARLLRRHGFSVVKLRGAA